MAKKSPEVAIIMGSQSDWETMQHTAEQLEAFGIPHETNIVSAHRTPDRLYAFTKEAKARGVKIIIAGAGGAAHLPGMAASLTTLPVLGVPVETKSLEGLDSLLSIVQMPAGVPVGTLAIGKSGAVNAALLAASILALSDKALGAKLEKFRTQQTKAGGAKAKMIAPGATIGIIGGGQLGRMSAMAAAELGYKAHIFSPDHDDPASLVAALKTLAEYSDKNKLRAFAKSVDVVTFEFENIPHESVELLEQLVPVYPGSGVLKTCRNRLREKSFVQSLGIGTAPFAKVTLEGELVSGAEIIGFPCILKTTEMGYDGKGQARIVSPKECKDAWESLTRHLSSVTDHEFILEGFVDFAMEISVIVARGAGGECETYVPVENRHKNHILDETHVPAPISPVLAKEAEAVAVRIAQGLDLRGLLAVEMFVTKDGRILVNELAPRPHNSGHWTLDACVTSQFEQHIRAVCGLPLGSTRRLCDAVMKNLIGDEAKDWEKYLREPNAKLHLYGKKDIRPGRKMGHVTKLLTQ